MSIGDRIKLRRKQLRISQEELAKASGVDQKQIFRYEKGISVPYAHVVAEMARYMGTSADWLVGLTDEITPLRELDNLTESEIEVLRLIRSKPEEQREQLVRIVKAF